MKKIVFLLALMMDVHLTHAQAAGGAVVTPKSGHILCFFAAP